PPGGNIPFAPGASHGRAPLCSPWRCPPGRGGRRSAVSLDGTGNGGRPGAAPGAAAGPRGTPIAWNSQPHADGGRGGQRAGPAGRGRGGQRDGPSVRARGGNQRRGAAPPPAG